MTVLPEILLPLNFSAVLKKTHFCFCCVKKYLKKNSSPKGNVLLMHNFHNTLSHLHWCFTCVYKNILVLLSIGQQLIYPSIPLVPTVFQHKNSQNLQKDFPNLKRKNGSIVCSSVYMYTFKISILVYRTNARTLMRSNNFCCFPPWCSKQKH